MDPCGLFHIVHRVLDDRQCAESQKVHLEQAKLLDRGHGELCRDRAVASARQRHKLVRRLLADHDARRVHGRVARETFQLQTHVDQVVHLLVFLVECAKLRVHLQRARDAHRRIALARYHLGDPVHIIVWQVERTPHIADHTLCRHRTERHDLHNLVMPVFLTDIIDHFLPPLIAEVNVDIGHRDALRVQEALKQQAVADRIDVGDAQTVRDDAPRRRTAPRPDRNVMLPRPVDEIPHDQEIIHIPHLPDDAELVVQLLPDRAVIIRVAFCQSVGAELVEIAPRVISLRNVELRQLRHAKLDLHIAPVRDHRRVVDRLLRIGKQFPHLQFALDIVLSSVVAHPVLVGDFFCRLDTEQDVVRLGVLRVSVVDIIRGNQRYAELLAHAQQRRVDCPLVGNAVILQLKEIIALSETLLISLRGLLCLLIEPFCQEPWHLARKTRGERDQALVILPQHLHIHARSVVIPLGKALADDLHQIGIARIVLRQQHEVVIPLIPAADLLVKARVRRDIDLAAEDRLDAVRLCLLIEINHAVHDAVVRDRRAVHAKLLDALDILPDLVGAVEQTILRMYMQMCKCHMLFPSACSGTRINQ